ncbi:hypothetical protein V6N11_065023 [Hibiscus sabdariffa]|uniref:Uncharacterized protein n=1 Tax=Hibiscus sabdariffa TaxID=183260 RepID=A0ABR2SIN0_9ROSI
MVTSILASTKTKKIVIATEEPMRNVEIKISATIIDGTELSFNYKLSSAIAIDLSDNLLHGENPDVLFQVKGLEYMNLSYNSLDGLVRRLENILNLRALDLSHNLLYTAIVFP